MSNFVNDAVMGRHKCSTCGGGIGQEDFFADFMEWWNNLEPIHQWIIIWIAGLSVAIILKEMMPAIKAK